MREMNCRKIQENKDGSTMIETLVAFLVVVLVILMFSKVVSVSSQVLNRTRQIMKENEAFNAEYYKLDSSGKGTRRTPVKSDVVLFEADEDGKKTGDLLVKIRVCNIIQMGKDTCIRLR